MHNILMFSALVLFFIGIPTCIILTVVFAKKKKKAVVFSAVGIPFIFVLSLILLFVGGYMYGKTDEYKEYLVQKEIEDAKKEEERRHREEEQKKIEEQIREEEERKAEEESRAAEEKRLEDERKEEEEIKRKEEEERIEQEKQERAVEEFKESCKEYSYKEIARQPENVKGEKAKFTGQVFQVTESGSTVTILIDITKDEYGFYSDTIYVVYKRKNQSEDRILENDIISIYGELDGLKTYRSVLGNDVTLPKINVEYVEIQEEY